MNKNNYCKTPQKKFCLPLCASVSIWWVFEECVQGWCMRTDFSNSRLPGQRFPVENIAQYRKTEAKPLRQVVYLISGINPTLSKPSHGFPLVCKALRKRNRQFRGGNQKKENSSAKFRWPGLLFFNYTQKHFPFISYYSPAQWKHCMNNMTLPFQEKVYVGALFGHYSPGFRRLAPKGHPGCMLGSQVEVYYNENTS